MEPRSLASADPGARSATVAFRRGVTVIAITLGIAGVLSGAGRASGSASVRPDLVVVFAQAAPEPGVPGEPMEVVALVQNIGSGAAPATGLRACAAAVPTFCAATGAVPALAPGAKARVQATVSGAATTGRASDLPYTFVATVDPAGTVPELREDNNTGSSEPAFIVVPVVPAPAPLVEDDEIAVFHEGTLVSASRIVYGPEGAPRIPRTGPRHKPELAPRYPGTSVDPRVTEAAAQAGPGGRIGVIVHYASPDDAPFPRLPDLDPSLPRFSDANARVLARRAAIFEGVRRQRRALVQPLMSLVQDEGGRVDEFFVLGWAFKSEIPASLLDTLSHDPRVRTVQPLFDGPPPANVRNGRDLIGTDPFYNAGADGVGWWVGLLDTGVRATHELLSAPDRIGFFRDCANGDALCRDTGAAGYNPTDNCDHGTASAGILAGNSNQGDGFRGVTATRVDSWRVYTANCLGDLTAVERGFDRAVYWGDKIIAAEIQFFEDETGTIADAADDAYSAGTVVVAANGNFGPGAGTVKSPAVAHNALGIGAYDAASHLGLSDQSEGPTGDDRVKPDVRFPSETSTASSVSDTLKTIFGGTSGATPYAAGAALVLVDQSWNMGWATDPGRIFSMLIGFGDRGDPFSNVTGAGDPHLGRTNDIWYRGARSVTNGATSVVQFEVEADDTCVEAAIWWAEGLTWHNDIDIFVLDAVGGLRGESNEVGSVFERSRMNPPFAFPGTWQLRIDGYSVRAGASPETVFYFVHVCD